MKVSLNIRVFPLFKKTTRHENDVQSQQIEHKQTKCTKLKKEKFIIMICLDLDVTYLYFLLRTKRNGHLLPRFSFFFQINFGPTCCFSPSRFIQCQMDLKQESRTYVKLPSSSSFLHHIRSSSWIGHRI